ncbi:hypothetical protein L596_001230 [Steinernema carpocapsae]|uniref:Uncharacterized protein n=1 Tax=Steinernema carpocapsae TaxID=34508 RepID=A0A4U8UKZ5_STECR|nr:hypothetical protein L596_001230 [Steinernema carpocapsae]
MGDEAGQSPSECTEQGLWEVEPYYYNPSSSGSSGNNRHQNYARTKRGKAFKNRSSGEYKCFEAHNGLVYRPGDNIFVDTGALEPFMVGTISTFKMVSLRCYFIFPYSYYYPLPRPEIPSHYLRFLTTYPIAHTRRYSQKTYSRLFSWQLH